MAVVALDRLGVPWADFRRHLANAIAVRPVSQNESPATAYYAAWLDALERLLAERGLIDIDGCSCGARARAAGRRPRQSGALTVNTTLTPHERARAGGRCDLSSA
jgi:hypothetical protein